MIDNKFLLATMVAKRAKELRGGAKALVESKYKLPIQIALEEIKAGKVYLKEKEEPLKSEDVFHEEEKSVKMEESVKLEGLSNEVEEPAKPEEIFGEEEKSGKFEGLLDQDIT